MPRVLALVAVVALLAGCARPEGLVRIEALFLPDGQSATAADFRLSFVRLLGRDGLRTEIFRGQGPFHLPAGEPVDLGSASVPWNTYQRVVLFPDGPLRVTAAEGSLADAPLLNRSGSVRLLVYPGAAAVLRVQFHLEGLAPELAVLTEWTHHRTEQYPPPR